MQVVLQAIVAVEPPGTEVLLTSSVTDSNTTFQAPLEPPSPGPLPLVSRLH